MVLRWHSRKECIFILMRQVREGILESADERAAHNALRALIQVWTEMRPSDALRSMAERLFAIHPLRTAGAIQLAAAILWRQESPTEQSFVSLDRRLCDVGYREGFTVLPKAF